MLRGSWSRPPTARPAPNADPRSMRGAVLRREPHLRTTVIFVKPEEPFLWYRVRRPPRVRLYVRPTPWGCGVSTVHVSVTVDGTTYERDVEPRRLLVHLLRD